MKNVKKLLKVSMYLVFMSMVVSCSIEKEYSEIESIEDVKSINVRQDGKFDVQCKDGRREVVSAESLSSDQVCLQSGGGVIDVNSTFAVYRNRVRNMHLYNLKEWAELMAYTIGSENDVRAAVTLFIVRVNSKFPLSQAGQTFGMTLDEYDDLKLAIEFISDRLAVTNDKQSEKNLRKFLSRFADFLDGNTLVAGYQNTRVTKLLLHTVAYEFAQLGEVNELKDLKFYIDASLYNKWLILAEKLNAGHSYRITRQDALRGYDEIFGEKKPKNGYERVKSKDVIDSFEKLFGK